jgi:7-cyano-7-deazaguanine reductase
MATDYGTHTTGGQTEIQLICQRKGERLMTGYTEDHARAGIDTELPKLEVWPNQFTTYEITVQIPEFTSICPKTKLPDFGTITIQYMPDKVCLELKALKSYILAFRDLGIFYENAVNRILRDVVAACNPIWAVVRGEFNVRGGMKSTIEARFPRENKTGWTGETG